MARVLLGLFSATLAGCLTIPGSRVGLPPTDADAGLVRQALDAVALPSFDRHVTGDGWVPHRSLRGTGSSGEGHRWHTEFACQKPADAPNGPVWRLSESDYVRILTPVRAAVLAAVGATGVEVTWASPVEFTAGAEPSARFEVRYLRRGREVAGIVEGSIRPNGGKADPDTRYTDLVVTHREWYAH